MRVPNAAVTLSGTDFVGAFLFPDQKWRWLYDAVQPHWESGKARRYALEKNRVSFSTFTASFEGEHDSYRSHMTTEVAVYVPLVHQFGLAAIPWRCRRY